MKAYYIGRSLQGLIAVAVLVLCGISYCGYRIYKDVSLECLYRAKHGSEWRVEYEKSFGPVARAHTRVATAVFGIIAISSLTIWVCRLLRPKEEPEEWTDPGPVKERRRQKTRRDLRTYYLRNAALGIAPGVVGIFIGVVLVLFRVGLTPFHSEEFGIGAGVFLCGYVAVLTGCWWWSKAKEWPEAVVLIGALPLLTLFIPFVRLALLASPIFFGACMVMMPLILIVVMTSLPDKTAGSRQKPWWDRE